MNLKPLLIKIRSLFQIKFGKDIPYKALGHTLFTKRAMPAWGLTGITCFAAILVFKFVNLSPHVDSDFFFASENPAIQKTIAIKKLFPQKSEFLVLSATGPIASSTYQRRLQLLTDDLLRSPIITSVTSLFQGPDGLQDVQNSYLWKRLLLSDNGQASNVIIFLEEGIPQDIIRDIERIISPYESPEFHLQLAGVPYVVEMIRRNLIHDLKIFSLLAMIVFGIMIVLIFRSFLIFGGTLIAATNACFITLYCTSFMGIRIGILTVNIATIIFVLTLSHIIFLTHNWKQICRDKENNFATVTRATRDTLGASFWCMITTLLGFLSLLFVSAKPLIELGISGSIGTVSALLMAYGVYPFFLYALSSSSHNREILNPQRVRKFFLKHHYVWMVLTLLIFAIACPGIYKLNMHPNLFSVFKEGSTLRTSLENLDKNGGSSPLYMVIKDFQQRRLNTYKVYDRLWALHNDLEQDPAVGSIISLPVLMAEGNRSPFAKLFTWEFLLAQMEKDKYGKIARSFISEDRQFGNFILRIKESYSEATRFEVIERLKQITQAHGFIPYLIGGIYILQGELANLVSSSLVYGLGYLIAFFVVVALLVSFSFLTSLMMVASLCIVPLSMLGILGHLSVPLDIISSPAANVAIAMGIDSMIHLTIYVRKKRKEGISNHDAWMQARKHLWKPIISAMIIISAGFGIFSLSAFPPTQRFGLAIVFGTIMSAATAIFILPLLASIRIRRFNT